jgi:hypothetical protein
MWPWNTETGSLSDTARRVISPMTLCATSSCLVLEDSRLCGLPCRRLILVQIELVWS